MKLEELKKLVDEKLTLKADEWAELIKEAKTDLAEMGVPKDQLDKAVVSKVFATLRKQLMSQAKVYEGIVLSVGNVTDFGAKKLYDKTKEMWELGDEDVKKAMIDNGEIDVEGNPLWCAENTKAKFKYEDQDGDIKESRQRMINPDNEKQKQIIGIFGEFVEGEKTEYKKTLITLWREKIEIDIPKYKLCKVRLNGKLNEEEQSYRLNSASVTEFVPSKDEELDYAEYSSILEKYFKDESINLDSDDGITKLSSISDMRIVFFKNAIPIKCIETDTKSNILKISSTKLGFDEDVIICWVSKSEFLPPEGLGEVIVCGNPTVNDDGISLNVFSIFSSFKVERPAPIQPPKSEEPKKTYPGLKTEEKSKENKW